MVLTPNFFNVHVDRSDGVGHAHLQLDDPTRWYEIVDILDSVGPVTAWEPLTFTLSEGVGVCDYMLNSLSRLCSRRMFDVVEANRAASDDLQWLECRLVDASGIAREYGLIHFSSHPDVLDRGSTIWAAHDMLVKPVVDLDKAVGQHIFSFPHSRVHLVVSSSMRGALQDAGCTGVEFSAIAVTPSTTP